MITLAKLRRTARDAQASSSGVAFAAQSVGAMAADLGPVNVAPPVPFTWTGFTLGANVGGALVDHPGQRPRRRQRQQRHGRRLRRLQLAIRAVLGRRHRRRHELGRISPFPPDRAT